MRKAVSAIAIALTLALSGGSFTLVAATELERVTGYKFDQVRQRAAQAAPPYNYQVAAIDRQHHVALEPFRADVGQSVADLPFVRQLHITIFEFLPGGKKMDWIGVIPDVEVEQEQQEKLGVDVAEFGKLQHALKQLLHSEEETQPAKEE